MGAVRRISDPCTSEQTPGSGHLNAPGLLGLLALVAGVLGALLIGQTLTGIIKTALYLYAS